MQVVWFRERVRAGGYPMFGFYVENEKYTDEVFVIQGRYFEALAKMKDIDELTDVPYLRVMNPNDFVEGLISEMSSWHDEVDPPSKIITFS